MLAYLADGIAPRRVDRCGKIGLYHGKMYVGAVNRGKEVVVQFDAETAEWVISDPGGVEFVLAKALDQFTRRVSGDCPSYDLIMLFNGKH